jgi:hypothetical protein
MLKKYERARGCLIWVVIIAVIPIATIGGLILARRLGVTSNIGLALFLSPVLVLIGAVIAIVGSRDAKWGLPVPPKAAFGIGGAFVAGVGLTAFMHGDTMLGGLLIGVSLTCLMLAIRKDRPE